MLERDIERDGTFLLHGLEVWGKLKISGADTQLTLRTEDQPTMLDIPEVIHGRFHDFTLVSCVGSVGGMPTEAWNSEGMRSWSWNTIPHQILSGRSHFDPGKNRINKVWFSTGDIYRIFDDFDSFGAINAPVSHLQSLLPQTIGKRQVPIGPEPKIVYFAGRCTLLEAELPFGKLEVQHWPFAESNSSDGARITTQIRVQVAFTSAVTLSECLSKIRSIGQFLSLVAGRAQSIENIQVAVDSTDSRELPLSLHWTFGPQQADGQELDIPSWIDIPLDGVKRADEFRQVIEQWFRSDERALARARLYSCREARNCFDVDRLVAAANMFDLTNTLTSAEVPYELAKVRDECLLALRTLPRSDDRDSAIMALSRIGKPTLTKKVLARAAVLRGHLCLEHIDTVLRQAVKCRNHFVHGPGDKGFKYAVAENHQHFLTETLEFVFAAAELIECGWIANAWRHSPHTGHHWFSRYISDYLRASQDFLVDLEQAKETSALTGRRK